MMSILLVFSMRFTCENGSRKDEGLKVVLGGESHGREWPCI